MAKHFATLVLATAIIVIASFSALYYFGDYSPLRSHVAEREAEARSREESEPLRRALLRAKEAEARVRAEVRNPAGALVVAERKSRLEAVKAEDVVEFAVVRVYYATNRGRTVETAPSQVYDASRSEVSYGFCEVSFPPGHRIGDIESLERWKVWHLEWNETPGRHVLVRKIKTTSRDEVIEGIRSETEQSDAKNLLLFVHGFGTTFEEAAKRTAQIKFDLAFEGPAVFFSWPAVGGWLGKRVVNYLTDEESSRWSEGDIEGFVRSVVVQSGAQNIYLIAHSMGSRPLSKAIAALGRSAEAGYLSNIRQLILAAPDIDRDLFVREVVPFVKAPPTRITVYASSTDLALRASEWTHGLYSRLGTTKPNPFVLSGIDTIDASGFASDFLGHDLPGARSILTDMFLMIRDGLPPKRRYGLEIVPSQHGDYWRMRP